MATGRLAAVFKKVLAVGCVGLLAACSSADSGDISKLLDLRPEFGQDYNVSTIKKVGFDPKLFANKALPPDLKYDPPVCSKFSTGLTLPTGAQGNMTEMTAEGQGNSFILMAVETSEAVPFADPGDACKSFTFSGTGLRGKVEKVDVPKIDGVKTLGTHRLIITMANGRPAVGELYNYVATFGDYMVDVIARPLLVPNAPMPKVNTDKARDLLSKAVAAVRGR
jgi:Domain of unknown function (DUF5642)